MHLFGFDAALKLIDSGRFMTILTNMQGFLVLTEYLWYSCSFHHSDCVAAVPLTNTEWRCLQPTVRFDQLGTEEEDPGSSMIYS